MRASMSLRWTVTVFTGFFLAASLSLVLYATITKSRAQWTEDALLHARRVARLLARTSHDALRQGDLQAVDRIVRRAAGDDGVERVIVLGRRGQVIADSTPGEPMPALLRRAPRSNAGEEIHTEADQAQVLVPVVYGRTLLGAVCVFCSMREQQAMLRAMRDWGLVMVVITILVACATAYGLAAVIATPMRRMVRSMQATARGELHERLPEEGCCEMRQMAHSFNVMSEALWRRMGEMESLHRLGLAVSSSLYLYRVAQAAQESLERELPGTRVWVWLSDATHDHLSEATTGGTPEEGARVVPLAGDTLFARAYRERQALLGDGACEPWLHQHFERPSPPVVARPQGAATPSVAALPQGAATPSVAALPLIAHGEVIGVVALARSADTLPLQEEDLPFLHAAASQIALALENARMYGREARVASLFQRVLLPPPPTAIPGLEIAARWRPAPGESGVTGDYYDFVALPDGRWGIVIGDVCGKGSIAASYTAMAKYVLRSYAYESRSPAEILQRTNATIYAQFTDGLIEEAPMFVTLFCALYDPATLRFTYAHAGHPLGTLARIDSRMVIPLDQGGPPLGVVADATYHEETLTLHPGDTVALYTDGVVEAARNGHVIEPIRIAEILIAHQEDSAQRMADALLEEAARTAGGEVPDDVTLLILRAGTAAAIEVAAPPAELASG